jgi:DnaJ-class molecular chaperone
MPKIICPTCKGTRVVRQGKKREAAACPTCKGTGGHAITTPPKRRLSPKTKTVR